VNSRRDRMSKTLEELGYKKEENKFYIFFRKQNKEIVFDKVVREVFADSIINEEFKLLRTCFTMEELKAIYKYCEDNKWI
jgi:hypothetical protein